MTNQNKRGSAGAKKSPAQTSTKASPSREILQTGVIKTQPQNMKPQTNTAPSQTQGAPSPAQTVSTISQPVSSPSQTARTQLQIPSQTQIASRAYEIWQSNGYQHGRDRLDWQQAERELALTVGKK
ncbi:MAG TPA: DUF2934 domain-containing protein [Drouetiella sp.]|jgi:Protein of unknown function (DUF2934)